MKIAESEKKPVEKPMGGPPFSAALAGIVMLGQYFWEGKLVLPSIEILEPAAKWVLLTFEVIVMTIILHYFYLLKKYNDNNNSDHTLRRNRLPEGSFQNGTPQKKKK